VRVHSGPAAEAAAGPAGARGLAAGEDVALGRGAHAPGTLRGRELLGHELAHVLQQRRGGGGGAAAEREARRAGVLVALGLPARVEAGAPAGVPQASPLSDYVEQAWASAQQKGPVFDRLRERSPAPGDTDLRAFLHRIFPAGSDDLWLAEAIVAHGPEPLWPAAALDERGRRAAAAGWPDEPGNVAGVLGTTAKGRPVLAYYFRGATDQRALIIGGVHGTEKSGVEVVEMLRAALLTGPRPHFTVVLVPTLFPDNYAATRREGATPTNRNFPAPGTSLAGATPAGGGAPVDELGKPILPENVMLMRLIERFRPTRLASVHATWKTADAGIFADPHRISPAAALRLPSPTAAVAALAAAGARTAADAALALRMATEADKGGARVPGNRLGTATPSVTWPAGSPGGTSMGEWGPTDVSEGGPADRAGMTVITVEVSGNEDSSALEGKAKAGRQAEFQALATVLREIFLGRP
jgi:hypothetical protein